MKPEPQSRERSEPIDSALQSRWRIEFAREIAAVYAGRKGVRTIVLGGSPSRGLSDEYSDLDIVVYWDDMDSDFISGAPLAEFGGKVGLQVREPDGMVRMELYLFGTLTVEVGHTTVAEWDGMLDEVLVKNSFSPHDIKSIGGFRDALPLFAPEAYDVLRRHVSEMPRSTAVKIVSMNLGFFWPGCILNQGVRRNEIVFYHDAFCMTVKRLVGMLAGLNHHFASPVEPRWLEYELDRMALKPADMWPRIRSIFTLPPEKAVEVLDTMKDEVIDLVRTHMPEVDMTRYNESNALLIQSTTEKPVLKRG
jgi:predicted nucleotidyltransferase